MAPSETKKQYSVEPSDRKRITVVGVVQDVSDLTSKRAFRVLFLKGLTSLAIVVEQYRNTSQRYGRQEDRNTRGKISGEVVVPTDSHLSNLFAVAVAQVRPP